jgi:hypothetical protein
MYIARQIGMMKWWIELEVMLLVNGTLRLVLVSASGLIALFNVNFMKL